MTKLYKKLLLNWTNANTWKRILFISVPAIALIIAISTSNLFSSPKWVTLISAEPQKIAEIRQYLDTNGIEYTIPNEKTIQVDESIKAEVLITLAIENLIGTNTGKGHEIFDQFSFGMTDAMYKVNETRALQDTVAQTIIAGDRNIKNANVLINLSDNNEDTEKQLPNTASVKIVFSIQPDAKTIQGIQQLVSAAVGNLKFYNVVVTDKENKLLSKDRVK